MLRGTQIVRSSTEFALISAESLSRLWAETGYDVVHDDVNHTVARRRRLVEIFRSHSRRVIAVVFEAPKSVTILERLISRDQVALEKGGEPLNIPEFVVDTHMNEFEQPCVEREDFDDVYCIPSSSDIGEPGSHGPIHRR